MNTLKSILVITLGILCILALSVADLTRCLQGKQSIDDEWHDIYVYGRINNGQGRKDNEER